MPARSVPKITPISCLARGRLCPLSEVAGFNALLRTARVVRQFQLKTYLQGNPVMRLLVSGVLSICLSACGSGSDDYASSYAETVAASEEAADAAEEARQAVYEQAGADSDGTGADPDQVDSADVEDTGDYSCTQDCSGHEAGVAWAQENDLSDESECGGRSQSFIEGCEAFARDRQEQADQHAQEAATEAADSAEVDYSEGSDFATE